MQKSSHFHPPLQLCWNDFHFFQVDGYEVVVVQLLSHVRLCDPMDCSIAGFPVLHHLPEFAQTHVHRVGDSIQPSHPLLLPLFLPSVFPSIRVFSSESALRISWPKYWSFSSSISASSEYSGLVSCGLTGLVFLQSKGLSRVFSSTAVWKHQIVSQLFETVLTWFLKRPRTFA